jgi:hypothetical protein
MTTTTARPVWKVIATVLVAVVAPPAALVAAFVSWITWSGCFMTCDGEQPNPLLGGLLGVLALGLLASGPLLAWVLLRSRAWVVGSVVGPALAAMLLLGAN